MKIYIHRMSYFYLGNFSTTHSQFYSNLIFIFFITVTSTLFDFSFLFFTCVPFKMKTSFYLGWGKFFVLISHISIVTIFSIIQNLESPIFNIFG